ncbi:hypothetical protein F4781DRAFT_214885 [Annulohypoxylon bovei var. microspora]|nr:hypothetical protein F4781DRAFT_214885 [Annulohypoxylon bovei var. microspora]
MEESPERSCMDIMSSKPFKFLIGPSRKEYFVHTEAFISISPVLRDLITGSMKEAVEGVAILEDIDENAFLGLCEFAYSGKYTELKSEGTLPKLPYRPTDEAWKVYGGSVIPMSLWFIGKHPGHRHRWTSIAEFQTKGRKFTQADVQGYQYHLEDWTKHILHHANMYILGDTYDVSRLQQLALSNINHILSFFRDTWDSIPSVEQLIRLVYKSTLEHDELRELVSSYVALKSENLFLHPDMRRVRTDFPEFCSDVLRFTTERLVCEQEYLINEVASLKRKNEELEKGPKETVPVKRQRMSDYVDQKRNDLLQRRNTLAPQAQP